MMMEKIKSLMLRFTTNMFDGVRNDFVLNARKKRERREALFTKEVKDTKKKKSF